MKKWKKKYFENIMKNWRKKLLEKSEEKNQFKMNQLWIVLIAGGKWWNWVKVT